MVGNHIKMDERRPSTIGEHFAHAVEQRADVQALGYVRKGELHWRTWQQVANDVLALAADLRAAGMVPGVRVAQVSENRYEWIITDLALHLTGAVHVPIHVTLSGVQIADQIRDCGARF